MSGDLILQIIFGELSDWLQNLTKPKQRCLNKKSFCVVGCFIFHLNDVRNSGICDTTNIFASYGKFFDYLQEIY